MAHQHYFTDIRYKEDLAHFIIFFLPEFKRLAAAKQASFLLQPGVEGDKPTPLTNASNNEITRRDKQIENWITRNGDLVNILLEMTNKTPAQQKIALLIGTPREAILHLQNSIFARAGTNPAHTVMEFFHNYKIPAKDGHTLNGYLEEAAQMVENATDILAGLAQPYQFSPFQKQGFLNSLLVKTGMFDNILLTGQASSLDFNTFKNQVQNAIDIQTRFQALRGPPTASEARSKESSNELNLANAATSPRKNNDQSRTDAWKSNSDNRYGKSYSDNKRCDIK